MSKTVAQIFAINPTTVVADTDLYYLVQSPYTPGADAAISGASLKAAFGAGGTINTGSANQIAYYAAAGNTISGTSTLPAAVQANITTLGTIASGVWNGTVITGTYGGTGVNNGASTITLGGSLTTVGAFASTFTMTGVTGVTFPVSGTLATTSQLLTSPLTTKGDIWTWTSTNARLAVGTTDGQVLQVSSGAATGLAYSTATYPTVATSAARILRADGTNWVQTTSTFADTYAASGFLYANGANNVAGLATANNGLPVTSNTGVPSILAGPGTTGNLLISNAAAAPSFTTFTYPTTVGATGSIIISDGTNKVNSTSLWPNTVGTSRKVVISNGTSNVYSTETYATPGSSGNVMTSDGTNWLSSAPTGSGTVNSGTQNQLAYYAANGTAVSGLATAASGVLVTSAGSVPSISSTLPAFTTSSITFSPTTGGIVGTTTNDNAAAGKVGEYISSSILVGSAVALTTATAKTVTSISLTAGDWDVSGSVAGNPAGTTTSTAFAMGISIVNNTFGTVAAENSFSNMNVTFATGGSGTLSNGRMRLSLSGTTTVYLIAQATFAVSTFSAYGFIGARRVR